MKKNTSPASFLNMGTSSLLVTFLILCIAIFATLSLSGSKSDHDFALSLAEQKQAYYAACSDLELALAQLDSIISEQTTLCDNAQDYFDKTLRSLDNEIKNLKMTYNIAGDEMVLSWNIPFSESKSLYVSVSIPYKQTQDNKHYYQILAWQTKPND